MTLRCEILPSDLDATVDFYTRVLRFTVTKDQRQNAIWSWRLAGRSSRIWRIGPGA